jgi:hypothetical protein
MPTFRLAESAVIDAPAAVVYGIVADYRGGHPLILPKPYFGALTVERGGVGAGTAISFEMRVMGRARTFQAEVTEPEPGRVLVESAQPDGAVTTFTVEPLPTGNQSRLEIATVLPDRGGISGALERWLTTAALRPIYVKELALVRSVAAERIRKA